MPARVQVIVEAKDAASGILRGITSQLGGLGQIMEGLTSKNVAWGDIAASAADMVVDAMKDAINTTVEYAESVRDLSLISGQGAVETSRFLQVLDDYQISAEDAEAATRALTKNGLVPNAETLAKLSDEYLKINDAQERNEFILKNLGRSGMQWVNMLSQGGAAIREMNANVNENLLLTDEQIKKTEEYRLAIDEWNDAVEGIKLTAGMEAITKLTDAMALLSSYLRDSETETEKAQDKWSNWVGVLVPAIKGFETLFDILKARKEVKEAAADADTATRSYYLMADEFGNSADRIGDHAEEVAERMKAAAAETTEYYKSLISDIQRAQSEVDRYAEAQADASEAIAQADEDLRNGAISLEEHDKILGDNTAKLRENEEAHKRWAAQTVFSFAQARAAADGQITKGEGEILIAVGQQLDLFDEKTATAMQNVNEAFDSLDTENAVDVVNALQDALYDLTAQDWVINISTNTDDVTIPAAPNSSGSPDERATGGEVYAGGAYTVGEAGAEPFFPAVNGRILGHSEALHAMSLGAGGGNYNFYGNVQLTIGSDDAAGLMEMR